MSELASLTLIKIADREEIEAVERGTLPEIHREYIIGLTAPGSHTLVDHIYDTHDPNEYTVREEELSLPNEQIGRMLDFYERCRVPQPDEAMPHDCHTFIGYLIGKRELGTEIANNFYSYQEDLHAIPNINAMQPGEAYVHVHYDGPPTLRNRHSMLGHTAPGYNLAVMGKNQPLFIVGNQNSMKSYGGSIHHVNIAPSV